MDNFFKTGGIIGNGSGELSGGVEKPPSYRYVESGLLSWRIMQKLQNRYDLLNGSDTYAKSPESSSQFDSRIEGCRNR